MSWSTHYGHGLRLQDAVRPEHGEVHEVDQHVKNRCQGNADDYWQRQISRLQNNVDQ